MYKLLISTSYEKHQVSCKYDTENGVKISKRDFLTQNKLLTLNIAIKMLAYLCLM